MVPPSVGIITPHDAQRGALQAAIPDSVTANTVEKYQGDEAARPWLIVSNHEGRPFHSDQYIALSLTTKTWMDGLIDIDPSDWTDGGTPEGSRVVPWAVQSIDSDDIDYWQGRVDDQLLTKGVESLVGYLQD